MASPADFAKNVQDWSRRTDEAIALDVRKTALDLFTRVILRTPVDTGAARSSWGVSTGATAEPPAPGQGGGIGAMTAAVAVAPVGGIIWLSNNLPYIRVLEYGLYPNPPKRGSWVKGKRGAPGHWEIKSVNGYSKQAPQGMVRVSIEEVRK